MWRAFCAGALTPGSLVTEQYLLDLERESFLSLCGERKTQERIALHTADWQAAQELGSLVRSGLMTLRAVTVMVSAAVMAAAVGGPWRVPAQEPNQAPRSTEQMETGRVRLPSGAEVVYRIRLLPLTSFPAMPPAVSAQLNERNCMVPQTYEARAPENVVHGFAGAEGKR